MKPVYVSLTTISQRISKIDNTLQSIFHQTYPITGIFLYISKESYMIDKGIREMPDFLKTLCNEDKRLVINYTENIGPYRKLLPLLREKWNEDCIIITIDDDKIYSEDMVEKLVKTFYENDEKYVIANRCCIKLNNILMEKCQENFSIDKKILKYLMDAIKNKRYSREVSYFLKENYDFIKLITFFEGNDGVLYHPKFFTELVFQWDIITALCESHDDFWFKFNTLTNGIGVLCISSFNDRPTKQTTETQKSALHFNINKGTYDIIINSLTRWFDKEKLLDFGFKSYLKI